MDNLIEKAAELADHIRGLYVLNQQEANVRDKIDRAYLELGALLSDLPKIDEKTTEQRRKDLS